MFTSHKYLFYSALKVLLKDKHGAAEHQKHLTRVATC